MYDIIARLDDEILVDKLPITAIVLSFVPLDSTTYRCKAFSQHRQLGCIIAIVKYFVKMRVVSVIVTLLPAVVAFTVPNAQQVRFDSLVLNAEANGSSGDKKKVIVLGGDGFCGWPTSLYLSDQGHDVVIVDNLSRRKIDLDLGCDSLTPISSMEVRFL